MKYWGSDFFTFNGNGFFRLCPSLGTNEFLRGHGNYQSSFSHPYPRKTCGNLTLGGGFRVNSPTLSRFFMLHFCLPFIISALVVVHIFFLHKTVRQNATNLLRKYNLISFH